MLIECGHHAEGLLSQAHRNARVPVIHPLILQGEHHMVFLPLEQH
jgi:hypothetical protein